MEIGTVAMYDVSNRLASDRQPYSVSAFSLTAFHTNMNDIGDSIAKVVLENFESWERKRKPQDRSTSKNAEPDQRQTPREWVPLCGIVAQSWVPIWLL